MKTVLILFSLLTLEPRVVYVPDGETVPLARMACDEALLRMPRREALRADGYPDLPRIKDFVRRHAKQTSHCPYAL